MGISNPWLSALTHDIAAELSGPNFQGPTHEMNGKNYSGSKVAVIFTAGSISGGPIGLIQAFFPDDAWHLIASEDLVAGELLIEAPRFPIMRAAFIQNGSLNTIDAYFAENSG